jgi:hypothetical protein
MKLIVRILFISFGFIGTGWALSDIIDLWPEEHPYSLIFDMERLAARTGAHFVFTVPKLIGSIVLLLMAMTAGLLAISGRVKAFPAMILGSTVMCLSILAMMWGQYIAGPVYLFCGAYSIATASD